MWASKLLARNEHSRFTRAVGLSLGLGVAFLLLQVRLWQVTHASGLTLSGIFGSVFYTLTWAHAAHIVGGVGALIYLFWGATQRRFTASRQTPVVMVSMFWHFLDVIWVCMFVGIFVL